MGFFKKNKDVHHGSKDPMEMILDDIHNCLTVKNEIRDNKVIVPEWELTISPKIDQLTDRSAVINFYLSNPDWEEPLFECCAGIGKDSHSAIGTAMGSFLFSFLHGIALMMEDNTYVPIESEFAGHTHRWRVYESNSVGMGEQLDKNRESFWELLREHIIKRLGNQRLCYVKVYAAKTVGPDGTNITGECRINDVASAELGALVAGVAEKWNVEQFASDKQFFFIKQEPETVLPYPYAGGAKIPTLSAKLKQALELILNCDPNETTDMVVPRLKEALGDPTLAEECYMFLPEICAENAFSQMSFAEDMLISVGGGERINVYKNQLADFYTLKNLMFSMFDAGVFGAKTDDLFRMLVGISSIFGAVQQLTEKGSRLEDCKTTSVIFQASEDFEIR
ncbi:MAG: hypothetical protein J1F09_00020 [Oscillospiraceae bacterium]|nr:hypothetical protein [Oscillospiraceae bacterium]